MSTQPKRGRGRPKMADHERQLIVSHALPPLVVEQLEHLAETSGRSRSAVLADLLKRPLARAIKSQAALQDIAHE